MNDNDKKYKMELNTLSNNKKIERLSVYYYTDNGRIKIHLNRILRYNDEDITLYRKLQGVFKDFNASEENVYWDWDGTYMEGIPTNDADTILLMNDILPSVRGNNVEEKVD